MPVVCEGKGQGRWWDGGGGRHTDNCPTTEASGLYTPNTKGIFSEVTFGLHKSNFPIAQY